MKFWSRGLGERTIDLYLGKGEAIQGGDRLYVKGKMEAPISWEYIVRMGDEDLFDFFALLREPAMADYVYQSPGRWRLIRGMVLGGLRLARAVFTAALRRLLRKEISREDVEIQLPPPAVRRRKRAVRRRLGSKRSSVAPGEASAENVEPGEVAGNAASGA